MGISFNAAEFFSASIKSFSENFADDFFVVSVVEEDVLVVVVVVDDIVVAVEAFSFEFKSINF